MQIIPAIDIRGGKCVRLRQGDYNRETVFGDDPAAMARRWVDDGAERLHLVDLDGAREGEPTNIEAVRKIVDTVGVPCQFGGGIRSECSLGVVLDQLGCDRAIVGTKALKEPKWFREMAAKFPGRIALGLDARDSMVATEGWLDVSQMPAIDLAMKYADLELACVIYTNIARDGMMQGIDDATIEDLIKITELGLPVVASGGVSRIDDIQRLAKASKRHPLLIGAIVGRALYENALTVQEAIAAAGA